LFFTLVFTANLVYHTTIVKLSPLQLVLVGTILETSVFVFEIPTGILADVKSRRLSIIIGYGLIGLGFIVEGSFPVFAVVAAAQVLWGVGYTFTSGATQAWIVDEIGEQRAGQAFLRASQAGQVGGLVGFPISVLLARSAVSTPIVVGGALMIALMLFLIAAMPETGFAPTPTEDRATWRSMVRTARDARQAARRQPLLLTVLGVGLFLGMYSEGLDRLWVTHFLNDIGLPTAISWQPVVWFGAIGMVKRLIGLAAAEAAGRRVDAAHATATARALQLAAGVTALGLAGFALARGFGLALALYLVVDAMRSITSPLYDAWLNQRIDDPQVRATLFSVSSQVDAIGQMGGGPLVGAIGNWSVRAALVASALLLAPVLPLFRAAIRRANHAALAGAPHM